MLGTTNSLYAGHSEVHGCSPGACFLVLLLIGAVLIWAMSIIETTLILVIKFRQG